MRTGLVHQLKWLARPYARLWAKHDIAAFFVGDMPPTEIAAKLLSRSLRENDHAEGQTV